MVIRVGHTGEQGKRIISVNRNGEREHKEENKDIGKRKEETMDFGGQAQDQIYDLWLCSFPGWSNNARCRLAQAFGGARSAYFASSKEWEGILSLGQAESLRNFTNQWRLEEEYEKMKAQGIRLITETMQEYPGRLRDIPDAPYALFVKGSLPDENMPAVAIVGARECSPYGAYVAEKLGEVLGRRGVEVISGMARGIDSISQQAAINAGGRSCAVLGSGVDVCYPARNRELYERLVGNGSVVSEYPLKTPARPQNFPPRNRIVSGLADVVVVVEAREKSGTLITVDMALDQGKEVYVVPGRITDRLSDGCNRLIRQGAGVLLEPEEFLEEFWEIQGRRKSCDAPKEAWKEKNSISTRGERSKCSGGRCETEQAFGEKNAVNKLTPEQAAVYGTLEICPQTADRLRERLPDRYREASITTQLMLLCMEGLAEQVSPGCFCLRKR